MSPPLSPRGPPEDAVQHLERAALGLVGRCGLRCLLGVTRGIGAGAPAEHHEVEQGVRAEAVGAVHRYAGALAGGVEPRDDLLIGTDHHTPVRVGRDAAHRVVGGRLDRHRLLRRLDLQVDAGELGDVGQLLLDDLGVEVGDVEVGPVAVGAAAATLLDLLVDRAAHHVAGREVLDRRGVAGHEALAVLVEHDAALAARRLRQQHAQAGQAGGVELEHLHVLQRDAAAPHESGAVAGQRVGVGGDPEHATVAARREDDRLRAEDVELAGGELVGHDAGRAAVVGAQQVEAVVLVEEADVALHALLVQGLQDHVAGAVGRVAGAAHRSLAVVRRVPAEASLVDPAVRACG